MENVLVTSIEIVEYIFSLTNALNSLNCSSYESPFK